MKLSELFETQNIFEFGSQHGVPARGTPLFTRAAFDQMATWLERVDPLDVRMAMANFCADVFDNYSSGFKREMFLTTVENASALGKNFRWQQRHYWTFSEAVKNLPNGNMKEYIGHWLGDKFQDQRARYGGQYDRPFRRKLWDSACGLEGANPRIAAYPHGGRLDHADEDED